MTLRLTAFFLMVSLVVGCGRYNAGGQPVRPSGEPKPPVTEGKKTTLVLFGAGFCGDCKHDFPGINDAIAAFPEAERKLLAAHLYYVAGDPAGVKPTDDAALLYRDNYFKLGTAQADLPWMWTNFKRLLPGVKIGVPAAVVLDENQNVVKYFASSKKTWAPTDIVAFVQSRLKAH